MGGFQVGEDEDEVMADINVTPLVDVMLVLLIIFMIATPMLHQGKEVALPRVDSETIPLQQDDPMVLTVTKEDVVYIKDDPVHLSKLVDELTGLMEGRSDKTVFLKGDKDVAYGVIMDVIGILNGAGVSNVALVTEPPGRR